MAATATAARRTAAKITQPRLARPLTRQRLHTVLDRMLAEHPVVWVAAPAGYGKTSLVSNYLERHDRPVAWYQIDERDEDVATCFHYLSLAVVGLDAAEPADLPRYSPEYARGLTAFARSFFGSFCAALPERATLVFDNAHAVGDDAALHQIMQVLVDELPVDCRVIIISRHLPPPAYVRLQANQRLAILERAQLSFSEDEALALLGLRGHDVNDAAGLQSWLAITQGWAAGLVLYSEWARLGQAEFGRLESPGTEAVFDYFAGEIQSRLAEADARFLAESALLPVMKPALAAELTGFAAAGELLGRLHRRNTFTTRFDGPTVAYEFHPLFREYLLKELARTHEEPALVELHAKAADLLARDGQVEAAMDLLAQASRWPEMATLLRRHGAEMINHGRHQLIGQWLMRFPDELFDEEPWFAYWRGACLIFKSAADSETWMRRAFYQFKHSGQVEGIYLAWCGVCRAIRFTWDDYSRFDPWIEELETLLDTFPEFPSRLECEVLVAAVAALQWRNPMHPRRGEWIARALSLADASGDFRLRANAYARAAFFALIYDQVPSATKRIPHLQRALGPRLDDPFVDIEGRYVIGLHAYATGDVEQAAAIFESSIEQAHALGLSAWDVILYSWYGLARLVQGDMESALRARARLESDAAIQGAYGAYFYHKFCADIAVEQDEPAQAMQHTQAALAAAEQAGSHFMRAWAITTLALLRVLRGEADAGDDLDAALATSRGLGSYWLQTAALINKALHATEHETPEDARRALQKAMGAMRAQTLLHLGYAPKPVRLFAARALEYGVDPEYAQRILAANPGAAGTVPPVHLEAWPWELKVYTLGPFRLVKQGAPVTFGRKPPRRPLEVLKALIAMGGQAVPEHRIVDALWPHDEADAARNAFSTALNRLRKIVGHELIKLEGGKLSLDPRQCWVDVWAFEALLARTYSEQALRQAVELYQDKFLAQDEEASWSISTRDRLQERYAGVVTQLAKAHQSAGDHEGAVALFRRGLATDELREDFYQGLMQSYLALHKLEEARQAFEFCKRRLGIRKNRKPSAATLALFESIDLRV
jgi:LuxR family transcriptional regulator, maltose regulon positive regulatory protein